MTAHGSNSTGVSSGPVDGYRIDTVISMILLSGLTRLAADNRICALPRERPLPTTLEILHMGRNPPLTHIPPWFGELLVAFRVPGMPHALCS